MPPSPGHVWRGGDARRDLVGMSDVSNGIYSAIPLVCFLLERLQPREAHIKDTKILALPLLSNLKDLSRLRQKKRSLSN